MKILFETTHGNITFQLNLEKAPKTCENFINYVKSGHYNGTIFHRVIKKFMIQCGGMDQTMTEKPSGEPIQNEANNGLLNKIGSVAMARTSDPHSATAQFFINVADNAFLDFTAQTSSGWGYAVFGQVVDGLDVVRVIEQVATGRSGYHQDVPLEPIIINKASVI
jgi:peptidyl-prolyl cis-trans isomerase B (cyclophilin B)